jgi:hypothetical protein
VPGSLLGASACGVSHCPVLPQESSCLPRKSTGVISKTSSSTNNLYKISGEFKPKESSQSEYESVSIDELVPDDHLLRLIDKYVDFSFLLEKVHPYSNGNGRPSDSLNGNLHMTKNGVFIFALITKNYLQDNNP